jgi:tripartite-type tricarboxylate transporter receptor subunit TctC
LQAAVPDGYTLAQLPVSVFLPPSSGGKSHAAAGDALVPVIQVSGYALGLSLSADSPLMSWENLAGWAKGYLTRLIDGVYAQASSSRAPPKALGLGLIQNEPFGIGAPCGTPPEVVRQLHDAFAQAMAQENFRAS